MKKYTQRFKRIGTSRYLLVPCKVWREFFKTSEEINLYVNDDGSLTIKPVNHLND